MPEPVPRRQAVLPNPPENVSNESFAGAIQRASRAVATAGEAFHARGSHNAPVIDLTGSPPEESSEVFRRRYSRTSGGAEAEFMSTTTHPHDTSHLRRPRLSSFLNDPVYGITAPPTINQPRSIDSLDRARDQRARVFQAHTRRLLHSGVNRQSSVRDEQQAVRRQQQNRITWQQTQARLRQFQQTQDSQPQDPELSLSSGTDESIVDYSSCDEPTFDSDMAPNANIESVDLTNIDNSSEVAKVLSKQRNEAIMSQRPVGATDEGRTSFTAFKCPICMEGLKAATVTKCGHIFCHKCVVDTLKWSSEQHREEHPGRKAHPGTCPVCRTSLTIKDTKGAGRTLIPLRMKLFTTETIRDAKGKRRAESEDTAEGSGIKKRKKGPDSKIRAPSKRVAKRESTEDRLEDLFGTFTNGGD